MTEPKLHTNTEFRRIKISEMRFEPTGKISLPDGPIQSNTSPNWRKICLSYKYFLIDATDITYMDNVLKRCTDQKEKDRKLDKHMKSLTAFVKFFKKKRIYVRLIPFRDEREKRVFAEEVMEIIPILMKRQNTPIRADDAQLAKWHEKSKSPHDSHYATFTVAKLSEILEEFNIDKSQITLIPDPVTEVTRRDFLEHTTQIVTFNLNSRLVSDGFIALNCIFRAVVMGVNWEKLKSVDPEMCLDMKVLRLELFLNIYISSEDACVGHSVTMETIKIIQEESRLLLTYVSRKDDINMDHLSAADLTKIECYHTLADRFGIPKYPVFIKKFDKELIPVWMHRMFCHLGWIQQFFNDEDDKEALKKMGPKEKVSSVTLHFLRDIFVERLYDYVPEIYRIRSRQFVNSVIQKSAATASLKAGNHQTMALPKLHSDTKFRVINLTDLKFVCSKGNEHDPKSTNELVRIFLPDGTKIQPNFYLLPIHINTRFFLMDHKEIVKVKRAVALCKSNEERVEKMKDCLSSLTHFSKHFKKTIYLRFLSPVIMGAHQEPRVFVDEVLEMIPIIMKQQKTPIEEDDARLQLHFPHRDTVRRTEPTTYHSVTVKDLEKIFYEFDINKSLITLVPDLTQEISRPYYLDHQIPKSVYAPDMQMALDIYQTINYIFEEVVLGVNWKTNICNIHDTCVEGFKETMKEHLQDILESDESTYFCHEEIREKVAAIRNHECDFTISPKGAPDHFLAELSAEDEVFIKHYHNVVKFFDLPKYPMFVPGSRKDKMPVWELRVLGILGWVQNFYDGDDERVNQKTVVLQFLYSIVPKQHLADARTFVTSIIDASEKENNVEISNKDGKDSKENETIHRKKSHKGGKSKKKK